MYPLLFTFAALVSMALLPLLAPRLATHRASSAVIGTLLAVVIIGSTSVYVVSPTQVGHLNRVYFGEPVEEGQVIAFPGQNGPQAEILGPGLHFRPFLRLLYTIEEFPVVSVPNGHYGILTAKDGTPLGQGQFLATGWPEEQMTDMLRAEYFLHNGGQKGTQLTVLRPGQYRLNQYLFDVALQQALDVEAGFVAVIKSNVQEVARCVDPTAGQQEGQRMGSWSAPLVPRGCVGVWQDPLLPGRYYLNQMAYQATLIPTRVQSLVYSGGYVRRDIDLTVSEDGKIVEQTRQTVIATPPDADGALFVIVEGWRIPLEIQMVLQVHAEQAPRLVAAVGDLSALRHVLLTPGLRSVVRYVIEAPGRKVLDLIEKRAELEAEVERMMQAYGQSVGIAIWAVRFGDPAIPPELMVVQQRQHIAQQLEDTYLKEQQAQRTRIDAEKRAP
jgi:regulator of protease activity HflC (stomatin/prohibitin superfamily)